MFNTIFATLILGEPFTRYSFAGTLLVCIGAVLIATFGAIGEPAHTLDQLLALLQRRPFLIWMGGTAVMVAMISVGSKLLKPCLLGPRGKTVVAGPFTLHMQRLQSRVKLFRGMCYGAVSGILSAHSLLLAKSAVELLVRTIVDRANQFRRWQSWVILLAMIFLALSQLYYLHRGLKLCSTSVLYPFVFCVYNIIAILDGLIYFHQASQLGSLHAGLIALGTFVLLGGVLCLSWRLEDIDSHAAVTVAGPTQTGLGPGMAIVEEHPSSPALLGGTDDEESQLGEREPLLQGTVRPRHLASFHRARAPSLPHITPIDGHQAADLNAASIWAELDDSDYDFADPKGRLGIKRPSSSSSSAAQNGPMRGLTRHSTIGPIPYHRARGPRRPQSIQTGGWRRSSAPLAGLMGSPHHRRNFRGASPGVAGVNRYGTIQEDEAGPSEDSVEPPRGQDRMSRLLTGPRRTLAGAWRQGRQFFSRWTSPQAGNQSESNREEGPSSPFIPRPDIQFPRTRNTHSNHSHETRGASSSL